MITRSRTGPRARVRILVFASVVTLLGACDVGLANGGQPGTVSGVVAAAKTAEGVANVVVVLVRDGRVLNTTFTSEEGIFRFDDVEPGRYVVGLTGLEFSGMSLLHTVLTPSSQTVVVENEPIDLTFAVVGIVPARIVGEVKCGSRPAVGAEIRVVGGSTAVSVRTDVVGRFGATDLAPGNYAVMAGEVPCDVGRDVRVVSLNAGQSISINFEGR